MLSSWLGFAAYLTFDPQTHFLFFSALLLHQGADLCGLYSSLLHPLALVGFRQWECLAGWRKARRDREDGTVLSLSLPPSFSLVLVVAVLLHGCSSCWGALALLMPSQAPVTSVSTLCPRQLPAIASPCAWSCPVVCSHPHKEPHSLHYYQLNPSEHSTLFC